jgi:hypothetical protein
MRLLGIKENAGIAAAEIGSKFLPALKDVAGSVYDAVSAFAEWVSEGDNLEKLLDGVTYALAGATAGLVAFLAVSKGAAVLQGLAAAFKGLTGAMAANPMGAIAVVITAVLIPALIALYKNWDTVVTYLGQGAARLEWFFKTAGSVLKEAFTVGVNAAKSAFWGLIDLIQKNLLGAISTMLGALEKITLAGKAFEGASEAVGRLSKGITDAAEAHKKEAAAAIAAAKSEQDAAAAAYKEKVALIDKEAKEKRAKLKEVAADAVTAEEEVVTAAEEAYNAEIAAATETAEQKRSVAAEKTAIEREITKSHWQELTERKKNENATAKEIAQIYIEQAQMLKSTFLGAAQAISNSISQIVNGVIEKQQESLNASRASTEEAIRAQYEWILAEEQYSAEELQALLDSANEKKLTGEQLTADERKAVEYKMNQELLAAEAEFATKQASLDKKRKEEAKRAAIFNRALALAQVPIDTARAVMKAIADFGPPPSPLGIAGIASASAVGTAQLAALMATPIPSAETGGRFVVPDTASGVDGGLLRVNRGEEVNVTPRGDVSEGRVIHLVVNLDGQPIIDFMNRKLRSGDVYEYSPSWA